MKWIEAFYFKKSEKIAIMLLLVLIVLSAILYKLSGLYEYNADANEENMLAQNEFEEFQKNLKPIFYTETDSLTTETEDYGATTHSKKQNAKLTAGQKVDLNAANIESLKRVPGIGDTYAKRIIEYRESLGGFLHPEQLMEVKGISEKKYGNIAPFFTVKHAIRRLKINKLDYSQLQKHPYFSEKQAQAIVEFRQEGNILSIEDLAWINHFSPKDIDRLSGYLSFD